MARVIRCESFQSFEGHLSAAQRRRQYYGAGFEQIMPRRIIFIGCVYDDMSSSALPIATYTSVADKFASIYLWDRRPRHAAGNLEIALCSVAVTSHRTIHERWSERLAS